MKTRWMMLVLPPVLLLAAACGKKVAPPVPPTLSSVPADGASDVPADLKAIALTSSEPLDPGTVNGTNIELLNDGASEVVPTAVALQPDQKTVTVTPAKALAEHTRYTLSATQLKAAPTAGGSAAANFTATFTTGPRAPSLASVTPASGATGVSVKSSATLTFSEKMKDATPSAIVLLDGSSEVASSVSWDSSGAVATLTPNAPLGEHTAYAVVVGARLVDADDGSELPGAPVTATKFTTGGVGPNLLSVVPADGASDVAVSTAITLTFDEAMTDTAAPSITLMDGSSEVTAALAWDATRKIATLTPAAALREHAAYQVAIGAGLKDADDLTSLANAPLTAATFHTGAVAPALVSITPAVGATGVATNASVTLVFSEKMDDATPSAVQLMNGSSAVAAAVAWSADRTSVTLTPASLLLEGVTYSVVVGAGAVDADDHLPLAGAPVTAGTFKTQITPPTVTAVAPANNTSGVRGGTAVQITFSAAMDPATVNASTVTLAAAGSAVAASVALDATSEIATLTPAANLMPTTAYTVTVTTGAKDYSEIPLASNFTSGFTTAAGPTVTAVAPQNGATGVSLTQAITATFSAAVQGVGPATFTVSDPSNNLVSGAVVLAGNGLTATFTPASPFAEDTVYTVALSNVIADAAGNRLAPFTSTFHTEAGVPSVTSAAIAYKSQQSGVSLIDSKGQPVTATNVALTNDTITLTFDHTMDATATPAAVTVTDPGGNTVSSTTSVTNTGTASSGTASVVTTIPSLGLALSTFTYTMGASARSLAGTPIAAPLVYKVVTEPALSFFTIPHNFTTGVHTNNKIFVVFNKPLGTPAPQGSPGAGNIKDFTLYLATPGNAASFQSLTLPVALDATRTIATIQPTSTIQANSRYTLQINNTFADANGNSLPTNYVHTWQTGAGADPNNNPAFDLDKAASYPADGASNVAASSLLCLQGRRGIRIAFNGGIDPTTAYSGTSPSIILTAQGSSAKVATAVSIPSNFPNPANEIDLCPTAPLAPSTTYVVTVPNTIQSATGNGVQSGQQTITFTTAPDAAPSVAGIDVSNSPQSGLSSAGTNTAIRIRFGSTLINPNTLNVVLTAISSGGQAATVPIASTSYDAMTNSAVVMPAQPFNAGDTVNVTVKQGVQSLNGTATGADLLAGTFTVGSGQDTTAPTASLANPATTNAPANSTVVINFSKQMDPRTLEAPGNVLVKGSSSRAPMALTAVSGTSLTLQRAPGTWFSAGNTYTVAFSGVKDLAGNAVSGGSLSFTISNSAPAKVGDDTTPGSSGQQLSPGTPLTVDIGDLLNPATVNPASVSVVDNASSSTQILSGLGLVRNATPGNSTIEIYPSAPWVAGHSYTVTLGSAIQDIGGLALANTTISFSTSTGPHIIGAEFAAADSSGALPLGGFASGNCNAFSALNASPILDITQLAGGASGNSCTSALGRADMPLWIEFDEPVNAVSAVAAANYALKDNGSASVPTLSCNSGGGTTCTVVKVVPVNGNWLSSALPASSYPVFDKYSLVVSNVVDASGSKMSSDWSTSFKTVTVEFYEPDSKGSETEDATYAVTDTTDTNTAHDQWAWFGSAGAKGLALTPSWITDDLDSDYQRDCAVTGGKTATMEMVSPDHGFGGSKPGTDIILRLHQLYGFAQLNGDALEISVNVRGSGTQYALLGGGGHYSTGPFGHSSAYPSGYEYDEYSMVQGAGIFSPSQMPNIDGVRAHFTLTVPGRQVGRSCSSTDIGWLLGSWALVAY